MRHLSAEQTRFALRCVGIALLIALVGAAKNEPTNFGPDQTEMRVSKALQDLQPSYTYDDSPKLESIVNKLWIGIDVRTIDPSNYVVRRRLIVQAWARIFSVLDRSYDSTFDVHDPKNAPYTCLIPPREADGTQSPSCADPHAIKDPVARAKYLAEIAANDERIRKWNANGEFSNIDSEATLSLRMQLASFRAVAPEDRDYLEGILRSAGLSERRRRSIDAMF